MTNTPGEPPSSDALPPELSSGEPSESAETPANSPQQTEDGTPSSVSGGEETIPSPPLSVDQQGGREGGGNQEEEPGIATVEVVRNVAVTDEPDTNFDVDFIDERIEFSQEETRAILAKSLIFLFAGTIGASFIYIFVSSFIPRPVSCLPANIQMNTSGTDASPAPAPSSAPGETIPDANTTDSNITLCSFDNSAKDLITLILNSITAIIGTALGFYFGTQTRSDRANTNKTTPGDRQSTE